MVDIVYERRMNDAERLMWRLEDDPRLAATFANLTILDRPPDMDRLRRRLELAAAHVPRLRQAVRTPTVGLGPPTWTDDPDFAVDDHVRRIALPAPGTERQLLDLAALVAADPFDRARPLWQFVVVEGLADGRAALIEKLHHTISDGEAGIQLALEFFDLERNAPDRPVPEPDALADDDPEVFVEDPTTEAVRAALTDALRLPLGVARRVQELLAQPDQLPEASATATETLRSVTDELRRTEPGRSPLWRRRSARRHLEVATAPLEAAKAAAGRFGGTLNTAFLALAAEAAGAYHAELGAPVDSLRASMAVSTRSDGSGANAFSLTRFDVPTGEMAVAERFAAIRDAVEAARRTGPPLDMMAALASTVPTALLTRVARRQANTVDFVTSNVKGSPVPLFVAGAQMLHNYPIGPLAGAPVNLTLLSHVDQLDVGLHTDPAAVEQPELLKRHFEAAFDRLVAG